MTLLVWGSGLPALFGKLMGAILVDPKKKNQTHDIGKQIKEMSDVWLCIAPEGARAKTKRVRSGFYYIAKEANIPIVSCFPNFRDGILEFSDPIQISGKTKDQVVAKCR